MNLVKTPAEIKIMSEGGKKLAAIRERLISELKVGALPIEIDNLAKQLIAKAGGTPSFMTVEDYQWATCISVNEGVVHGVPDKRPLQEGDVVGLDVGLLYKGFHTDTSWTILVQNQKSKIKNQNDKERFIRTGEEALQKAIAKARVGNRVGHISQAIQETIEGAGYSVVRSLVGHGVGRVLHEAPQIPGLLSRPIAKTPLLEAGMVIAIEVIYNRGVGDIVYKNQDSWTLISADKSISGLFEQTVAIISTGPIVLTQS